MAYRFLRSVPPDRMEELEDLPDAEAPLALVMSPGLRDTAFLPRLEDETGRLLLEPGDGLPESIVTAEVKILGHGGRLNGMPAEAVGRVEGELYVTSCRLVFAGRNFDHGIGVPLTLTRAVTAATATRRSKHRFIAVQVRYPWLKLVGVQNSIRFSSGEGLLKRKNALRVVTTAAVGGPELFHFACESASSTAIALLQRALADKLGIADLKDEHYSLMTASCNAGIEAIRQASPGAFTGSPDIVALPRKRLWAYSGEWSAKSSPPPV